MIISHELVLEEAPNAYENFDKRNKGWTKVALRPNIEYSVTAAFASYLMNRESAMSRISLWS